MSSNFPEFPKIPTNPAMPGLNGFPSIPEMPGKGGTPTLGSTFSKMLGEVSKEVEAPYQMAKDMVAGKKPFDSTELMVSMMDAERKLNISIRVLNEFFRGIKQIETSIQV